MDVSKKTCMRIATKWMLVFFGMMCIGIMPLPAESLRGAVARVEITPPPGLKMWGFAARKGPSTGTLDPLYAKVLVLASSDKRIAVVTLDLGRSFGPASLASLQESVRKSSNITFLLVAASHTHSGPSVANQYPEDRAPDWETAAIANIAKAIDSASAHLLPVRIGADYGLTYIGYNRLQTKLDRSSMAFGNDSTQIVSSPVDPTVAVLRIDTQDGQPMAILVNYACHAVVFGADNLRYSADFPAVMASTVEEAFPSHPLAFFLQGGAGDIDPYYANTPLRQDAQQRRQWTGERLGTEAVRVAKKIQTQVEPDGSLDFAADTMSVPTRWDLEKFAEAYGQIWSKTKDSSHPTSFLKPETILQTSTLLINKRIAFMSMSGEPFVDLQIDWRNRCPVHASFFVGYANGYSGYFPTISAAVHGGYGADNAETWAAVGSGERMVNNSVIRTYELLGKLSNIPK